MLITFTWLESLLQATTQRQETIWIICV